MPCCKAVFFAISLLQKTNYTKYVKKTSLFRKIILLYTQVLCYNVFIYISYCSVMIFSGRTERSMPYTKFLYILSSALSGEHPGSLSLTSEETEEILRLAELHKLLPLIFDCIHSSLPKDFSALRQKVKLMVSQQALRTESFKSLYASLNDAGLTPILVKGIICRSLYPCPDLRISADEDLLIPSADFERYRDALISQGFSMKRKSADHYQTSFVRPDGFYIELHTSLFDNTEYFDKWNNIFSNSLSQGIYEEIEGMKILTLSPTDHLLYLILHALKHFIHSGVGIRQVCDIFMFICKHHSLIDFEYIFTRCEEVNALKFATGLLAICKKHLDAGQTRESLCLPISATDETALLEDILCAGIYGSSTESRRHSGSITFNAAKKGKRQWILKRLLPAADSLDQRYSYARHNKVLLPVAWGHRLLNYRKETAKSESNSTKEAIRIGNNRMALLKEYGLVSD